MGRGVREFYGSTLREIKNAIQGYNRRKKNEYEEYMYGIRKVCHSVRLPYIKKGKVLKEEDIFPLDIDKEIKMFKLKGMTPIEVIHHGKQSNG